MDVAPEAARSEAIGKALDAEDSKKDAERRFIPWKEGKEKCVVIETELATIILNPRSHRIRAQLDSHPNAHIVQSDPESSAAQTAIEELLKSTDGYSDIKTSLQLEGQKEPGVVTRAGVLINGNTRAVALRELGREYIRVMVLPRHATQPQISELELRLQVSKDFKQDYTFTNQLLFVRECLSEAKWTYERVAEEVGYSTRPGLKKGVDKVRQDVRVLTIIEEIRSTSGKRYPYTFFDEAKQALEEIDRDVELLRLTDPRKALDLRGNRLIGVLAGLGYRELRHVQPDFLDQYLVPEIEENEDLAAFVPQFFGKDKTNTQPEGLDLLGAQEDASASAGLLSWLMETKGNSTVSVIVNGKKFSRAREEVVEDLRGAMESGIAASKDDRLREDLIDQPVKRLQEARQKVRAAAEALKKATKDPRFAEVRLGKTKYIVNKLKKETEDLALLIENETGERTP